MRPKYKIGDKFKGSIVEESPMDLYTITRVIPNKHETSYVLSTTIEKNATYTAPESHIDDVLIRVK